MAYGRMFSRTIIAADEFRLMSPGAQAIYLNFGVEADDDGIVNSPLGLLRLCGIEKSALDELEAAGFIYQIDGRVVIRHWFVQNSFRSDRKVPSIYTEILEKLELDEKGVYHLRHERGVNAANTRHERGEADAPIQDKQDNIITPTPIARARARETDDEKNESAGVILTADDLDRMEALMGAEVRDGYIAYFAEYLAEHPEKRYPDHCQTIINWWKEDKRKKRKPRMKNDPSPGVGGSFDTDEFFEASIARTYGKEASDTA